MSVVIKKRLQVKHNRPSIVFIVGPTASGKSGLAMRVAQEYGGEIICADSQTVRTGLDIGTAKPSKVDQTAVPHHMLDVIGPYDRYSVAQFKSDAEKVIQAVMHRGRLPIVVGGTGLYIDALLYDFRFRGSSSSYSRGQLEAMNVEQLQEIIKTHNYTPPENYQNPRHLVRTIESQGKPSEREAIRGGAVVIGIDPGPETLLMRITDRVEHMVENGFLEEVERVIARYGMPPQQFDAIGYKIALDNRLSKGVYNIEAIKEQFIASDRKYSKRQRTWLKRNEDILWFEHSDDAYKYVSSLL